MSRAPFHARPPEPSWQRAAHGAFSAREKRLLLTVWRLRGALKRCQRSESTRQATLTHEQEDSSSSHAQRQTHVTFPDVHIPARSAQLSVLRPVVKAHAVVIRAPVIAADQRASRGKGSLSRQLLASTSAEPAKYELRTNGQCAVYIATVSECQLAASALGLVDTTASNDGKSNSKYDPPGCYITYNILLNKYGSLKVNMAGTNTGSCRHSPQCLCKLSTPTRSPTATTRTEHPTRTPTQVPTRVPTVQLKAPRIAELLRRCNSVMNTTFNEASIVEADIGPGMRAHLNNFSHHCHFKKTIWKVQSIGSLRCSPGTPHSLS